jgi:hypothetical protein
MHGIVAMLAKKGVVSREGVRSSCKLTPIDQQHPKWLCQPEPGSRFQKQSNEVDLPPRETVAREGFRAT